MPHDAHAVPLWVTLVFAGILTAMVLALAMEEKLHAKKSLITGVTAMVALLAGAVFDILPFGPVTVGEHEHEVPIYILAIDWGVIIIILGSSLFVDITARSGLFTWIAVKLTKASKGDPLRLLYYYGVMTVVFSAVLNNVTAMIIMGSLTAVSLDKLQRSDKLLGFLLIEGLLTNVGGLLTLISSVPNIIVGQAADISFGEFFIKAAPFVVVATIVTLLMGASKFKIKGLRLEHDKERALEQVQGFDENDGIESWGFFRFGAGMTVLFIIAIATTSVLPAQIDELGMGFVAMSFAMIMLIRFRSQVDKFYQQLDWDLLLFFAFLFIVINVMEHARVLDLIGVGLKHIIALNDSTPGAGTGATLAAAAGASAVTDNIPLAAMLAKILGTLGTPQGDPLWWSVIFGANLGGNITPIGSASTVVAVTIMHRHKLNMGFASFVKTAIPFAVVQIIMAIVYVLFVVPRM